MYHLITAFLILCNEYDLAKTIPMFGENVRYATDGEFPFVVSVANKISIVPPDFGHICTGVLVSRRDVLTTEHCSDDVTVNDIQVIVGSHDLNLGIKYDVSWWMFFNEWSRIKRADRLYETNDIMIIRLEANIDEDIIPVLLSSEPDANLYHSRVELAGFSKTSEDLESTFMETVEMTIMSRRECELKISALQGTHCSIVEKYLCANANPTALMIAGNSGSAVLFNGQLIGIHRGTTPSCLSEFHPEKVNLFMSINFYRNFIIDIVRNFE